MAVKRSDSATAKRSDGQTVKTSLQLPAVTAAQLAGLVAATGLQHSAIVAAAIENYVSRLGNDKRAVVQAVITARLGKSAASSDLDAVIEPQPAGQGRGGDRDILPADRLAAFSRIHAKATSPIDAALESL